VLTAVAVAVCAFGIASFGAAATGGGFSAPVSLLAAGYDPGEPLSAGKLEPASRREAARSSSAPGPRAAAKHKRAEVKLKYYIGADFLTVAPGIAQLFEIRCPKSGEQPLTGGSFEPAGGLVVVNSSRTNPSPDFPTSPRAWYEAVINVTATPLQWKPFATCVRNR
jgi:hypothetical protein